MPLVKFFIRHPQKGYHSIEELFKQISSNIDKSELVYLPYPSNNISNFIKNLWFVYKNQGEINHITGDCHYILLALKKNNFNIITVHDCILIHKTSKWKIKYWIYLWFWFKIPLKIASKITTISEKTKNDLYYYTGIEKDKIVVIPNFVNPKFKYNPKIFNQKYPEIIQIGTSLNKNLNRVVESLNDIPCHFTIIGKISDAEKGLLMKNKVDYSNYEGLSFNDLKLKMENSDIVIFASTYEGFGMPVIEAQSIGRALITSNISPINDIAGIDACKVDPLNIEEIRFFIKKIIKNDLFRNNLIITGLENVKKYKIENVLKLYSNIYNNKI